MSNDDPKLLRNAINKQNVRELAQRIQVVFKTFAIDEFCNVIDDKINELSLKGRIDLVCDYLRLFLPDNFLESSQILVKSLGPQLDQNSLDSIDLSARCGFIVVAKTTFIARYGMEHFDVSMNALYEMTKRFSSEGDIRLFIKQFPDETFVYLNKWINDDSVHARRLVSECTRPRLPLCCRLHQFVDDPMPVIGLLDQLKDDSELYVRRSVANNLNDIAKDNPQVVTDTLERWNDEVKSEEMQWLTRHALRTLLKQGNPQALQLLGYSPNANITVGGLSAVSDCITLGETLEFSFTITSRSDNTQPLMIDYIIHHVKANGTRSPKVFKLSKKKIARGETLAISKKHAIKPISTRKYYPGTHTVEIQINGKQYCRKDFELL